MFNTPQMGGGGYTDPKFLNALMGGLGGYQ
jgi:hypothetical protein